jgi:hypothetical protein
VFFYVNVISLNARNRRADILHPPVTKLPARGTNLVAGRFCLGLSRIIKPNHHGEGGADGN